MMCKNAHKYDQEYKVLTIHQLNIYHVISLENLI